MFKLLRLFYDITLFRKGPQEVPFSPLFTRMTLITYAAINFLMRFMSDHWFSALLQVLADVVILMLFTRFTLAWARKSKRYQQTLCALLGVDAFITLCAIPATAVMLVPSGDLRILGFFIAVGLMLWHWAVIGHILGRALSQSLSFGLGVALLYMMAAFYILNLLFPPALTAG